MGARIRHAAIYTQNPDVAIAFYQKIFGMKRITTALTQQNRGHISDGVVGLAVLARRPAIPAGLDHFGFEVDDIGSVVETISEVRKSLTREFLVSYKRSCRQCSISKDNPKSESI